jgi:preprotein translocase subunit SecY
MKFFEKIKSYLTNKEILQRLFFTLFVLLVFRALAKVPAPGIEKDALANLFGANSGEQSNTGAIFNLANVLAGGTLSQFSIISVGLFAFISASVIFQLLGPIVPKVDQLQKMGETGKKVLDQWTRILTIPLAAIQSFGIYLVLSSPTNPSGISLVEDLSNFRIATLIFVLVAGTMLLIWLAELCSEKGLGGRRGGGISVIITAGILASLPTSLVQTFANFNTLDYQRNFWAAFGIELAIFALIAFIVALFYLSGRFIAFLKNKKLKYILGFLYSLIIFSIPALLIYAFRADAQWAVDARTLWETNIARLDSLETRFGFFTALSLQLIAVTTFFNESVRRIPISFIARIRNIGGKAGEEISYLPVKLLAAGVMPIIFSSSFLLMPAVIHRFFSEQITNWNEQVGTILGYAAQGWLDQFTSPYYHILNFVLTVLFSMFFITIVMKSEDIAKDLKGRKTFIPGIRPGDETVDFLSRTILRTTFWGGLVLATISSLPFVLGLYTTNLPLGIESFLAGGTSVLIVVPTILSIKAQVDALVLTKNYEQFEDI